MLFARCSKAFYNIDVLYYFNFVIGSKIKSVEWLTPYNDRIKPHHKLTPNGATLDARFGAATKLSQHSSKGQSRPGGTVPSKRVTAIFHEMMPQNPLPTGTSIAGAAF